MDHCTNRDQFTKNLKNISYICFKFDVCCDVINLITDYIQSETVHAIYYIFYGNLLYKKRIRTGRKHGPGRPVPTPHKLYYRVAISSKYFEIKKSSDDLNRKDLLHFINHKHAEFFLEIYTNSNRRHRIQLSMKRYNPVYENKMRLRMKKYYPVYRYLGILRQYIDKDGNKTFVVNISINRKKIEFTGIRMPSKKFTFTHLEGMLTIY